MSGLDDCPICLGCDDARRESCGCVEDCDLFAAHVSCEECDQHLSNYIDTDDPEVCYAAALCLIAGGLPVPTDIMAALDEAGYLLDVDEAEDRFQTTYNEDVNKDVINGIYEKEQCACEGCCKDIFFCTCCCEERKL